MVKTITKLTAAISAVAVLALAAPASATGEGQIEGGNIYRIKNLTKNSEFVDPASADACDELMYRVRIHNPGPGSLTNVIVKATLPGGTATTHTSTVTITGQNAMPASTSDSAAVHLSTAQSLSYISGSTQLLDANGGFMKTLPDGIVAGGSGVNIGNVGVSINEKRFVQFKVKISCPQPPKEHKFACEALEVTKVSRTQFNFTAKASVTNTNVTAYVFTAKDADGNTVDSQTVNTSALSANYSFSTSTPGTYTISVVVKTDKGDAPVGNCFKQVTVEEEEKPPVQPPAKPPVQGKVTELPDTGAGAIAAVFAGVSTLAGVGHYMFRRFIG